MQRLIEKALRNPGLLLIFVLLTIFYGIYEYRNMPVDAFPDISPVMVPVFCESHGLAPEEMERLITWPIESAMNGLPGVNLVKSTSAFGLSVIYVYFDDDTDIYFARQLVAERLNTARADLPGLESPPTLGPISTGLGQIFIYYLSADPEKVDTGGKELNTWLRELNDWVIKYQLQTVKGVTDVLSMGGHALQYQIRLNPQLLAKYHLTIEDVIAAVKSNNRNAGGQFLTTEAEELLVRGIGLLQSLDEIRSVPVKVFNGTPVLIRDIAEVEFGNEVRRGVVMHNGGKEVVSGIVLKLYGENTSQVIGRLHEKIAQVRQTLPEGVDLKPYYDQASLVNSATHTVISALLQGAVLVLIILLIFMGNMRTAFIVVLSLPLCALIAIIIMTRAGISANLMSLGGIAVAIGMLCDGSIVMMESILTSLKRNSSNSHEGRFSAIYRAADEVARPILFSGIIVIIVFLPLLTLQGVEGKMFSPMAFSISAAMIGSLLVALFCVPALSLVLLKKHDSDETIAMTKLQNLYRPARQWAVKNSRKVILAAIFCFIAALGALSQAGSEFMPVLEEGSIFISVAMAPSISLKHATVIVGELEKKVLEFSEVREVISRIGRPEAGSHPHPVNYGEIQIELHPGEKWKSGRNKAALIEALNKSLSTTPGVHLNFTQPIQNAFDELVSGVKSQLAIKVFGPDLKVLQKLAEHVNEAIEKIPGLTDLAVEQSFGQPQIQITADREKCARNGISVNQILEMVEIAIGGEVIDNIYLNNRRFGIHLRYDEKYRSDTRAIENLLVSTPGNGLIPLGQVAKISSVIGPMQINRENNQRRWTVQGNIRGRDLGSVVADIEQIISEKIQLPVGYSIEYGGQFENQQRAMLRLSIIVPAAVAAVFLMLWLSFASIKNALIIFTMVPLSIIGGIAGLLIMGQYLSVPASVGFIALFGMAMLDGMVMVSCFNDLRRAGHNIDQTIHEGCEDRLAAVVMTTLTTLLGLIPLLLATGAGSEVQRPLASVVVFGLLSSTTLTLFVIPAVYYQVEIWLENRREKIDNA